MSPTPSAVPEPHPEPWDHELVAWGLWHAMCGWGDEEVANATEVAATWPVTGTTMQSRVEAFLRPGFSRTEWATFFDARFSSVSGVGSLAADRAAELVDMCSRSPPSVAMQAVRFLVDG